MGFLFLLNAQFLVWYVRNLTCLRERWEVGCSLTSHSHGRSYCPPQSSSISAYKWVTRQVTGPLWPSFSQPEMETIWKHMWQHWLVKSHNLYEKTLNVKCPQRIGDSSPRCLCPSVQHTLPRGSLQGVSLIKGCEGRRCVEHCLWVNQVPWKDPGWISICPWPALLFHWTPLCLHDTAWLTSKNPFIFAEMTASTALKRWLLSFDGTVGMAECPESQGQGCQLFSICFSRTGSPLRTLNPHRILGDDWEGP